MKTHTFEISASASKHGGGTAASYDDPDKKIIERVTYSVRSEVTLARDPYLTFTENLLKSSATLGRDWKGLRDQVEGAYLLDRADTLSLWNRGS